MKVEHPRGAFAPRERTVVATDGVELHVIEAGAGLPVVLVHGFPELAYSWRFQVPALAAAGYRVLALDQRGYGRSGCPAAVEAYDIVHITGDLLTVLDALGEERAVFVGHEIGAAAVWTLALLAPQRVAGVVALSLPFLPRGSDVPTRVWQRSVGDMWVYLLHVQKPGVADAELALDPRTTLRRMLTNFRLSGFIAPRLPGDRRGIVERLDDPPALPPWLTHDDLDHYVEAFTRTGFTGGLNAYRNIDRNWTLTRRLAGRRVEVPSLFVAGRHDPMVRVMPPRATASWLDHHHGDVLVDGAGRSVHMQKADEVNAALLGFLADVRRHEAARRH